MSLKQRGDLYGYAKRHMQLENIVKKGHEENKVIVFPDLCTFDNVFINEKEQLSLIDYEGLQVGEHISVNISTNLGNQENYIHRKYLKNDLFTPEIDKTGLIIMYFLAAFHVDLKIVGQINPMTGNIMTVKDVFEIMELQDEVELMKMVEMTLSNKEKGVYLGNKMFELASKYNMEAYSTSIPGLYLKKLKRK